MKVLSATVMPSSRIGPSSHCGSAENSRLWVAGPTNRFPRITPFGDLNRPSWLCEQSTVI